MKKSLKEILPDPDLWVMVENYTDNKKTNISINTKMTIEEKIKEALKNKTKVEQIAILERLCKHIRQQSSIRVYGRRFKDCKVDEREDELKLKGEM